MFGNDDDTAATFDETVDFVLETRIDLPRFAHPDAVSRARRCITRLRREGRILTTNWDLYDGQHVVFQPKQLSVAAIAGRAMSGPGGGPMATRRSPRVLAIAGIANPAVAGGQSWLPLLCASSAHALHLRLAAGGIERARPQPRRRDAADAGPSGHRAQARRQLHAHLADGAAADRLACRPDAEGCRDQLSTTTGWRRSTSTGPPISSPSPSRPTPPSAPTRSPRNSAARKVPVVMGGFHATLAPDEVGRLCRSCRDRRGRRISGRG